VTTKQGRGVTQAVAFDAATVGGAWVGVWGSIGELGAHYMCEVRFGSVLRFQLGVQKTTFLPKMKTYNVIHTYIYLLTSWVHTYM
jgi:hypothetical protein